MANEIITPQSAALSTGSLPPTDIVPPLFLDSGDKAWLRYIEFFTANIRNANTRSAYAAAVRAFCTWCEHHGINRLHQVSPFVVAAYVEDLAQNRAAPTVKQALAAIRMLFDFLVIGQVLPANPATSVRGPSFSAKRGKTPVLSGAEARTLLNSIDTTTIGGLRDRALISVMVFSFARVNAVTAMNVEDFYQQGKRHWFRLHEKRGKRHDIPAHHNAEDAVAAYIEAATMQDQSKAPLFRSLDRRRNLTANRLNRRQVLAMIKRRAKQAGLSTKISCHSFRATGITLFLQRGGTLENAQLIANHESPRTTKLYDRSADAITLDEIERIVI